MDPLTHPFCDPVGADINQLWDYANLLQDPPMNVNEYFHTVIVITLRFVARFFKQQINQVMALARPYLIHFCQWSSVDARLS
jgi:hypothetical protein